MGRHMISVKEIPPVTTPNIPVLRQEILRVKIYLEENYFYRKNILFKTKGKAKEIAA